jgi:hypothetical protein
MLTYYLIETSADERGYGVVDICVRQHPMTEFEAECWATPSLQFAPQADVVDGSTGRCIISLEA